MTKRLSSVEVNSPPRITIASGCSISCPGRSPEDDQRHEREAGGQRGHQDRREPLRAARSTRSTPNVSPSSRSRCWAWLISRMPLRAAMPNTVKNPTSDPIDRIPPVANAASTPADRAPAAA